MSVPASTEAYFAYHDARWREVATENPGMTPEVVQVHNVFHVDLILIRTSSGESGLK